MIEQDREELPPESDTPSATPDDMTEALGAVKASSPSLAAELAATGLTPDDLADAHDRATTDEPDVTQEESNEPG